MTLDPATRPAEPTATTDSDAELAELDQRTFVLLAKRLIPLVGICYFLSYLDRTNLSVAALTMNKSLGISSSAYGLGAGLFFIGYFFVEVPSNLIMRRVGASRWIARIMISWGIVAMAQAFIVGPHSFYLARIALGVAEAGFFPGVLLYLTLWFPAAQRARVVGLFMAGVPASTALGAPIGGWLLKLDGDFGIEGWQWLFLIEGVPAVLVGLVVWRYLPDYPKDARWLSARQRDRLDSVITAEAVETGRRHRISPWRVLIMPRVIALSLIYFAIVFGLYGLGFWIPTIIKKSLNIHDNLNVSLLTAAPYAVGTVTIVLWGRLVDRRGHAPLLTAIPMTLGGLALTVTAFGTSMPWLGYAGLSVCAVGIMASFPGFWTLPSAFLSGVAAAVGLAIVNAVGNLAGFAGPYWVGWTTEWFGAAKWGLVSIGLVMILGAAAVLALGSTPKPVAEPALDAVTQPPGRTSPSPPDPLPTSDFRLPEDL